MNIPKMNQVPSAEVPAQAPTPTPAPAPARRPTPQSPLAGPFVSQEQPTPPPPPTGPTAYSEVQKPFSAMSATDAETYNVRGGKKNTAREFVRRTMFEKAQRENQRKYEALMAKGIKGTELFLREAQKKYGNEVLSWIPPMELSYTPNGKFDAQKWYKAAGYGVMSFLKAKKESGAMEAENQKRAATMEGTRRLAETQRTMPPGATREDFYKQLTSDPTMLQASENIKDPIELAAKGYLSREEMAKARASDALAKLRNAKSAEERIKAVVDTPETIDYMEEEKDILKLEKEIVAKMASIDKTNEDILGNKTVNPAWVQMETLLDNVRGRRKEVSKRAREQEAERTGKPISQPVEVTNDAREAAANITGTIPGYDQLAEEAVEDVRARGALNQEIAKGVQKYADALGVRPPSADRLIEQIEKDGLEKVIQVIMNYKRQMEEAAQQNPEPATGARPVGRTGAPVRLPIQQP